MARTPRYGLISAGSFMAIAQWKCMSISTNNYVSILVGLVALVISSYISFDVPLNDFEIPISLQSLVVLLVCFFLGRMNGMLVILAYLILGAVGLPVFADGNAGVDVLMGKSGGYLFGFLLAVIILESFFQNLKHSFVAILVYMTLGTAIILLSGGLRLLQFYGPATVWEYGIQPFLLGGLIKIIVGALLANYFWKAQI